MGTRSFFIVVGLVSTAAVALAWMGAAGLDIPFLRQVTGLAFLMFVPGLLILRVLRFRSLAFLDTALYAAGLSIAAVMFLGLFINLALPYLGIPRPISILPVIISLAVVTAALGVPAYFRGRRETSPPAGQCTFDWPEALSPPVLLLVMLPFISVLGTYLVNAHASNILLLALLGLIALVVALIGFNKFIPPRLYPLAIFTISLSLLWHWSLISGYLWGWDIHYEYYHQSEVLANGVWNSDIFSNVNSMLSIVILAPVYSLVLGLDSAWVFKIVYALFFSLLPLALFQIFRRQTNDRLGALAVFLFISFSAFFADLAQLARQQVAELFFALFVMAMLDAAMTDRKKAFLLIVFGMSIVVSHYGLAYFFLFYLVLGIVLLVLLRNRVLNTRWDTLRTRIAGSKEPPEAGAPAVSLNVTMVFLMIVLCFAWYMYIGRASPFHSIINVGVNTLDSLREFFAIESREAGALMAVGLSRAGVVSVQRNIFLILQYAIQLFIIVGVIGVVLKLIRSRFQPLFIAMSLVSLVLLVMCLILPRFSMTFNIGRFYHIALLFLAPFCLIGGVEIIRWLSRIPGRWSSRLNPGPGFPSRMGVPIVVSYLLFSTGFVYAVTGDEVASIALNPDLDGPRYDATEVAAREWLRADMAGRHRVFADFYGNNFLVDPAFRAGIFWGDTGDVPDDSYILLRTLNAKRGLVIASEEGPRIYASLTDSVFGREVLARSSRIYDSGGARVYDAGPASGP